MGSDKFKTERKSLNKSGLKKEKLSETCLEWLGEENSLGISLKFLGRKVKEKKGEFFNVVVFDCILGHTMVIDEGEEKTLQTCEKFDFYDEVLSLVPLALRPEARRALIVGGGDGKIASILAGYLEEITVVDPAKEVFEACRDIYWSEKALEKVKRVEMRAEDYVEREKGKFDIIIGDFTDPYEGKVAGHLISGEFLANIRELMNGEALFVFQAGSPIFQPEIVRKAYRNSKIVFKNVRIFWAPVPLYPLGVWCFCACSDSEIPAVPAKRIEGDFYTPEIHRMLFTLPPFIRKLVS